MSPRETDGKQKGQAVSDNRGVIAALAIDQRSAMQKLFGQALGCEPAAVPAEKTVQFKEAEAGCVKLLFYHSSPSDAGITEGKHAFVERVGAECTDADVPFFLELVSYGEGMDDKGVEFAKIKSKVVAEGMAEFSKPQNRVDVLKVGVPVNLSYVEGSPSRGKEALYSRAEALRHYRDAAAKATIPFTYLSEGVSNEAFQFALELAAGVPFSGVLCGRSTWQDGIPVFVKNGMSGLEDWLRQEGVTNIENVNRGLKAAQPWHSAIAEPRTEKSVRHKGKGRL